MNKYCICLLNIYLTHRIQYNRKKVFHKMRDFKPIKQEKSVISIRIDTEILNEIDKQSAKIDISRNEFIVQCIKYAIEHLYKE